MMLNAVPKQDNSVELCSGYGQYHSAQGNRPKPYSSISTGMIEGMVYMPQKVDKSAAQWAIFSTLKSRSQQEQKQHGRYFALWADIDESSVPIGELSTVVNKLFGEVKYFVYTSKSATLENQKARIIIPLANLVGGNQYSLYQRVFNDKLTEVGIIPDRKSEPVNQICYLPNQGEFYDAVVSEFSCLFDPDTWRGEISTEQERLKTETANRSAKLEQSKLKATERIKAGTLSPIDAFNEAYSIPLLFDTYGYKKAGNRWLSPNSESGVPGVTLSDNGNKWHSQHGSDSDIGQNGFGDAFDLFTYYEHHNDKQAAIKAAGVMFEVNGVSLTKSNQQQYMQAQEATAPQIKETGELFDLAMFALNDTCDEMERKMLDDKFILGELALLGQATAFYAKPNAGKTLLTIWLLIEAIKSGDLKAEDVFYLNCDDNHKGLIHKGKLAKLYGFNMLAQGYPEHRPFKLDMFEPIIKTLVKQQTASGKVLVLDTLKKFVDLMNKKSGSDFGKTIREFVSHGGSVILLAHVNKHRGEDGKPVYSGTSDIVDDIDCAYLLDVIQADDLTNTVRFENIKSRGDVANSATYQYPAHGDYKSLLDKVQFIEASQEERLIKRKRMNDLLSANLEVIDCALQCLHEGIQLKTELVNEINRRTCISRKTILKALKDHTGTSYHEGHRWLLEIENKNGHKYKTLPSFDLKAGGESAKT